MLWVIEVMKGGDEERGRERDWEKKRIMNIDLRISNDEVKYKEVMQ